MVLSPLSFATFKGQLCKKRKFWCQNHPKSDILFHKNGSPWDLYIMALLILYPFIDTSIENHQHKDIKKRFPKKELLALLLSTFFPHHINQEESCKGKVLMQYCKRL